PLPGPVRTVVTNLTLTGGYTKRASDDRFGTGSTPQLRARESRTLPFSASIGLSGGLTASYSANFSTGEGRDATGRSEDTSESHQLGLTARIQPPEHMRARFSQLIQASLRYSYQAQQQCRVRGGTSEEEAACTPYTDLINRGFNLSLET